MAKIKVADFYYGAVLSMLFNNKINPALVENNERRQIYDILTNEGECRLIIKYRARCQETKKKDYNSWQFLFADSELKEIGDNINSKINLAMALVCGMEGLKDSEIAVLDHTQIEEIIKLNKKSITISRMKNERAYRVAVGGGRETSIQVKANSFNDVFK